MNWIMPKMINVNIAEPRESDIPGILEKVEAAAKVPPISPPTIKIIAPIIPSTAPISVKILPISLSAWNRVNGKPWMKLPNYLGRIQARYTVHFRNS